MSATPKLDAPSDLELMMLLDGELDATRRAEVEAFLAGPTAGPDPHAASRAAARGKLDGMRAVAGVVATFEWPSASAPARVDLADRVMGAIAAAGRSPAVADEPSKPTAPSDAPAAKAPRAPAPSRPANDNSRAIFGFAIAAAAAAAAMFFWGKTSDRPHDPVAMTAPPVSDSTPLEVLGASPPATPIGDLAPELAKGDEAEPRYGVEVASVDFGARSGAIYYVPAVDRDDAAGKAAVTTVVWLNDD